MKRVVLILPLLVLSFMLCAQVPDKMSYQAVIRDSEQKLMSNQEVNLKISILKDEVSGPPVYVETQDVKTNSNGLVSFEIGTGNSNDKFSDIDWSSSQYFIKTETDPYGAGSGNYTLSSTAQLLSVPYAMHANSAERISETVITPQSGFSGSYLVVSFSGGNGITFSGASPVALQFEQASRVYPKDIFLINDKKMDVYFEIPYAAGSRVYDVVLNPFSQDSVVIKNGFKVYGW